MNGSKESQGEGHVCRWIEIEREVLDTRILTDLFWKRLLSAGKFP